MSTLFHWFGFACFIAFCVCVLILPVLAIFRATRSAAGGGYIVCSFIFGGTLWIACFLTVGEAWGWAAALVGLLVAGIGVLPMSMVIFAINSQWFLFFEVLGIAAVAIGVRVLGVWLMKKP